MADEPTAGEVSANAWAAWLVIREGMHWSCPDVTDEMNRDSRRNGGPKRPFTRDAVGHALDELVSKGYASKVGCCNWVAQTKTVRV